MIRILYTPKFIRMYKGLELGLKEEIKEKIELFKEPKNHLQLKVHKLTGLGEVYSFFVNYKVRIIFEYENKKRVNLLYIGSHDEVY